MNKRQKYLVITDKGEVLAKTYYKLTANGLMKELKLTTKENLNIINVEQLEQFKKVNNKVKFK